MTEEIRRLPDIIIPYLVYDKEKHENVLSVDAPPDVVDAYQKLIQWLRQGNGR